MSASATFDARQHSTAVQPSEPPRYSLVHVMAMPMAFAVILVLTRLAAG